ncbi:MAG: ATP-binding cassette domain-containing protein [Acidobacteria bacterium]|nr:ATP-binding cassette domain-containing protein [Acidobacteriota bacterium]
MSEAAIRFEKVSKSFGSRTILKELSFEIGKGDSVAILGRSGTGKSVTLKLMIGLLEPDAGDVFVLDRNVADLDASGLSELRREMGFLFQSAALFDSISVGENIAFPMRRQSKVDESEIRDRVEELLRQVKLDGEYDKMPADLSGGMKKRAALARSLALRPSVLLVDEPSAGLDPITSEEIDELLISIGEEDETTIVIVTHNIPSARRICDEMILLDGGLIRARGDLAALEASDDEVVKKFLSSQSGG